MGEFLAQQSTKNSGNTEYDSFFSFFNASRIRLLYARDAFVFLYVCCGENGGARDDWPDLKLIRVMNVL